MKIINFKKHVKLGRLSGLSAKVIIEDVHFIYFYDAKRVYSRVHKEQYFEYFTIEDV